MALRRRASSSRPQLRPMAMEDSLSDVFGVGGVLLHHRPKPRVRPRSAAVSRQRQLPESSQSVTAGRADAAREVQVASKGVRPSSAGPRLGGRGSAATQAVTVVPNISLAAGDVGTPSAVQQAPPSPQWVVERSVSFSEQGPEISMVPSADANLSLDMADCLQLHGQSASELTLGEEEAVASLSEQSRPGAGRGRGKRFKVLETVALLAGPSMQSARVGTLQKGEVVMASEVRGHKLFVKHRGWCCRRLSDKVLMVQLGGGVVPGSVPAALRQQQVVRHVARQRSEQQSGKRQVRSMRGSQAHGSTATLQTVVRRQRPSSAPISGRRPVGAANSVAAGPSTTTSLASNVVNGRSLAGAYPAVGGATVPETGASRPRPRSAGSSRQLYDTETSPHTTPSSVHKIRETQQDAPSQIRGGIGAGGLPWQSQRLAAPDKVQSEIDLNVDPRLHQADTTVTFHEHSRPGVPDDVATAWQSLSMPDASVQKWKAEQRRSTDIQSDAAPAGGASASRESDTFMMVRGIDSSAARSVLDVQTHGKIYDGNCSSSSTRSSRPTSTRPDSQNKGQSARPSSAPASRGVRVGGRNPNSVGGAGGGDRARLRRPASASERARERRLKLEAAVSVMDQGPVISIDIPSTSTNPTDEDGDSWGPLIDPRVNIQSGDVDAAQTFTQSKDKERSPRQSVVTQSTDPDSVSDASATASSAAGANICMGSGDQGPDQTGVLDPESVEFTAALIEWGRACDAGAEPVGSIPEEQRKVMVARAEAQRIISDALDEAVALQQ